jgi:hypothetical protein
MGLSERSWLRIVVLVIHRRSTCLTQLNSSAGDSKRLMSIRVTSFEIEAIRYKITIRTDQSPHSYAVHHSSHPVLFACMESSSTLTCGQTLSFLALFAVSHSCKPNLSLCLSSPMNRQTLLWMHYKKQTRLEYLFFWPFRVRSESSTSTSPFKRMSLTSPRLTPSVLKETTRTETWYVSFCFYF